MTRNPGGRPPKLTPERQARICEIIAAGSTYQAAADAVGVTYHTLLNWKLAGSGRRSGHYFDFFMRSRPPRTTL